MSENERIVCRVTDIAIASLDPVEALAFVDDPAFGGTDLFVGRVRSANRGRVVTGIHYDMFGPLALKVFVRSAERAIEAYGPDAKVYVAHAKGLLRVGDPAVIVAFAAPHRDAAFRGCRDVIETVKHEAPIWKQEHYLDGSSEWSEGCALCADGLEEHVATSATASIPAEEVVGPTIESAVAAHACSCACGAGGSH